MRNENMHQFGEPSADEFRTHATTEGVLVFLWEIGEQKQVKFRK